MSIDNIIEKYENIALSNFDILKILDDKTNIILYPDLYQYRTLDECLQPYGSAIILFEAKPQYGHWVCVFKTINGEIEFFNPYGGYPDDSLWYIPYRFREVSHQLYPHLSYLLINSPYELSYNEFQFQKHGKNIKTCGRWCCARLLFRQLDLYEFKNLIDELKRKLHLSGDKIVTLLTMNK